MGIFSQNREFLSVLDKLYPKRIYLPTIPFTFGFESIFVFVDLFLYDFFFVYWGEHSKQSMKNEARPFRVGSK